MHKLFILLAATAALSACMGGGTVRTQPGETTGEAIAQPTDGFENEISTND